MEFQEQNVGTEIATEELCCKLTGYEGEALTDSVKIWCGTYGIGPIPKRGWLLPLPLIILKSSLIAIS
jgi:hypothetical protein